MSVLETDQNSDRVMLVRYFLYETDVDFERCSTPASVNSRRVQLGDILPINQSIEIYCLSNNKILQCIAC